VGGEVGQRQAAGGGAQVEEGDDAGRSGSFRQRVAVDDCRCVRAHVGLAHGVVAVQVQQEKRSDGHEFDASGVRHLCAAPPCKTVTPRRLSNCGNTRCAAPPCDSSICGQQASTCAIAQGRRVSSTTSLTMQGSGSRSRNRRVNGELGGAEQGTTHRRSPSTHSAMRFCLGAIQEHASPCCRHGCF
jgi:hypothetical protein